jgi:hypothetical protein
MNINEIIRPSSLSGEFLYEDFRQFRVATKSSDGKKVTIDIDTGKFATGPRAAMPLYTYRELEARGDIPGADYLQFVPEGTPYAILDFDTNKKLPDKERQEQVDYIRKKILHQFDGCIELSSSGLGIHAYIQDERAKGFASDPLKFQIMDDKERRIDVELFASNAPIILTCDFVEEPVTTFDRLPAKLVQAIKEKERAKDNHAPSDKSTVLSEIDIPQKDLDTITERFKTLDTQNRIEAGYAGADDCSSVDYAMANMLLRATGGNKDQSYSLLHSWMQKWRPVSQCKKRPKEITNKAQRAIQSAYEKLMASEPESIPKALPGSIAKTMKEAVMERSLKAGQALERVSKSRSLAKSTIFEGTLNVLFAKSGSGKSKMAVILTMMIAADHTEKYVY